MMEREKGRQKKKPGAQLRTRCGIEVYLGGVHFKKSLRWLCIPILPSKEFLSSHQCSSQCYH